MSRGPLEVVMSVEDEVVAVEAEEDAAISSTTEAKENHTNLEINIQMVEEATLESAEVGAEVAIKKNQLHFIQLKLKQQSLTATKLLKKNKPTKSQAISIKHKTLCVFLIISMSKIASHV